MYLTSGRVFLETAQIAESLQSLREHVFVKHRVCPEFDCLERHGAVLLREDVNTVRSFEIQIVNSSFALITNSIATTLRRRIVLMNIVGYPRI